MLKNYRNYLPLLGLILGLLALWLTLNTDIDLIERDWLSMIGGLIVPPLSGIVCAVLNLFRFKKGYIRAFENDMLGIFLQCILLFVMLVFADDLGKIIVVLYGLYIVCIEMIGVAVCCFIGKFLAKRGDKMEPKDYIISKIEGEYAYLRDVETGNEIFIALALLPMGADLGSRIHCEMFQYTLAE